MKIQKETWIRTAVLLFSLMNQVLIIFNCNPLPFSEAAVYEGISVLLTLCASLWNWWKNNSFSKEARMADDYLKWLREQKKNG